MIAPITAIESREIVFDFLYWVVGGDWDSPAHIAQMVVNLINTPRWVLDQRIKLSARDVEIVLRIVVRSADYGWKGVNFNDAWTIAAEEETLAPEFGKSIYELLFEVELPMSAADSKVAFIRAAWRYIESDREFLEKMWNSQQ